MLNVKEKNNLLFANELYINDKISIHIPTLQEIIDFGESEYFGLVQNLTATPFDMMVELDDIGIDYEQISNFQLFILMFKSFAAMNIDSSIIFGNLKLVNFFDAIKTDNNEHVLLDEENDIVIDELVAAEIQRGLRKILFFDEPIGQAGNSEAKKYMIERKRKKRNRLKNKPYKSFWKVLLYL